jgi:DNA-binding CsgD family transcriptional regulator
MTKGETMNIALTRRELEVLRLLASGCSYRQAATHLGISPHTVVSHVKNAYRKLDAHTAACAVARAMRLGLLESLSNESRPRLAEPSDGACERLRRRWA